MTKASDGPEKMTQLALADNGHQAAANAKLHEDARPLQIVETPAGRLIELKVGAHDTLLNLGRELYRTYAHHEASPQDLKAFEADAARRNKLSTRYALDHLHEGQPLTLSLPGVNLPHAERSAPAHTTRHETPTSPQGHQQAQQQQHERVPIMAKATVQAAGVAGQSAEARALMKGASSCSGEWTNMVGQWVSHNEVSQKQFLAFNPNDHGAGISIGLLQWNQKKGSLPELLADWHKKDPAKFDHLFGAYSANLLKANWVREADFNGNATLNQGIHAALSDPEFQKVQADLRDAHITKSCHVAAANGFLSLRGRAVVADLYNQIGEGGTIHALQHVPQDKPESARIEALKQITGHRTNGTDRVASIEDKVKDIWRKLGTK
jgi:hypothetical protein